MTRRADVWDGAGCLDRPELPWIADGSSRVFLHSAEAAAMAAVCASCPVRATCAELAEQTRARAGFWAGRWRGAGARWLLTPAERQTAARAARTTPADTPEHRAA